MILGEIPDKTPQDMIIDAIFRSPISDRPVTEYVSSKLDPSRYEPFHGLSGLLFTSRRATDGSWQVSLMLFKVSMTSLTILEVGSYMDRRLHFLTVTCFTHMVFYLTNLIGKSWTRYQAVKCCPLSLYS